MFGFLKNIAFCPLCHHPFNLKRSSVKLALKSGAKVSVCNSPQCCYDAGAVSILNGGKVLIQTGANRLL